MVVGTEAPGYIQKVSRLRRSNDGQPRKTGHFRGFEAAGTAIVPFSHATMATASIGPTHCPSRFRCPPVSPRRPAPRRRTASECVMLRTLNVHPRRTHFVGEEPTCFTTRRVERHTAPRDDIVAKNPILSAACVAGESAQASRTRGGRRAAVATIEIS